MEKLAEISDLNWKMRKTQVLNTHEKVGIIKRMELTRRRRLQHEK